MKQSKNFKAVDKELINANLKIRGYKNSKIVASLHQSSLLFGGK